MCVYDSTLHYLTPDLLFLCPPSLCLVHTFASFFSLRSCAQLPCCCTKYCRKRCQSPANVQLLHETNKCCCCPKSTFFKCPKVVNFAAGGCCCLAPTSWDFIFESNRSRPLSLWNLVMCMLLLFSTLNPLGSVFESSPGCENAFGFRPGILQSSQDYA